MEDLIPRFSESVDDMVFAYTAIMEHSYSKVKVLNPPDFKNDKDLCLAFMEYVTINKYFPEFLGFDVDHDFKAVLDKTIP